MEKEARLKMELLTNFIMETINTAHLVQPGIVLKNKKFFDKKHHKLPNYICK